jgi:predicted transcriptional regulator
MDHMKVLTISLSDELEQRLREVSGRQRRTPEDAARDILRRRLLADRFGELCRESEEIAKAAGYKSEDEILRTIS